MYLSDGNHFREYYQQQIRGLNSELSAKQDNLSVGDLSEMLKKLDENERFITNSIELDVPTKTMLKANILKIKANIFLTISFNDMKKNNFEYIPFEEVRTEISEKEFVSLRSTMEDGKYVPNKLKCEYGGKEYSIAMDSIQLGLLSNPTKLECYSSIYWLLQKQNLIQNKPSILYIELHSEEKGRFHSILDGIEGFDMDDFVLGGKGVEINFKNVNGVNKICRIRQFNGNLREIVNAEYSCCGNYTKLKLGENRSTPTYCFENGKLYFSTKDGKMALPNSIRRLAGEITKHYAKRVHGIPLNNGACFDICAE